MKIDFKKLKEHLLGEGFDDDEVLEGIEKLKGLPFEVFDMLDECINSLMLEKMEEEIELDSETLLVPRTGTMLLIKLTYGQV